MVKYSRMNALKQLSILMAQNKKPGELVHRPNILGRQFIILPLNIKQKGPHISN